MIAKNMFIAYSNINTLSICTERGRRQKSYAWTSSIIIDHVTLTIRRKGVGGEREFRGTP